VADWADWVNSVQHQVCSILFLFYFYFYFLFQIQFKPCLNSKFPIYAQEKLYMMQNFYIIFIYSVILFRLGFQHEVHTPHYYFEC
jgi:4-amino-4-deoxy-L-arabinose transferase-like glycosyltransferase